jgi:hypothetical protein
VRWRQQIHPTEFVEHAEDNKLIFEQTLDQYQEASGKNQLALE